MLSTVRCTMLRCQLVSPTHTQCLAHPSQAYKFGTSTFLQASDYEAPAEFPNCGTTYILNSVVLNVTLGPEVMGGLLPSQPAQFRVTLSPETFSNFNGLWSSGAHHPSAGWRAQCLHRSHWARTVYSFASGLRPGPIPIPRFPPVPARHSPPPHNCRRLPATLWLRLPHLSWKHDP